MREKWKEIAATFGEQHSLPGNKDSKLTVTLSVTLRRHFEMREKLSTFALAKEEERRLFLFLRF